MAACNYRKKKRANRDVSKYNYGNFIYEDQSAEGMYYQELAKSVAQSTPLTKQGLNRAVEVLGPTIELDDYGRIMHLGEVVTVQELFRRVDERIAKQPRVQRTVDARWHDLLTGGSHAHT